MEVKKGLSLKSYWIYPRQSYDYYFFCISLKWISPYVRKWLKSTLAWDVLRHMLGKKMGKYLTRWWGLVKLQGSQGLDLRGAACAAGWGARLGSLGCGYRSSLVWRDIPVCTQPWIKIHPGVESMGSSQGEIMFTCKNGLLLVFLKWIHKILHWELWVWFYINTSQ